MARVDEIVSRIQKVVGRGGTHLPPDAADLAEMLASSVEEVNDRLSRCVTLIREGRRAEAIHLAELSPPALDQAAALEFPGREDWVQICESQGLEPPPEVDAGAVQEINEAYPATEQTGRLLKVHRRLALGRGRLKQRIKVMRHLSQAEPDNPSWGDDIVTFEKARHGQIADAATNAGRAHDMDELEGLYRECCEEPWLEKPPKALREAIKKLYRKEKARWAKARLAEIEMALQDAYQMQDSAQAVALLSNWDAVVSESGVVAASVETAAVTDVRDWLNWNREELDRQESMDRACHALEDALDAKRPLDRLEKLWAAVTRHELSIPNALRNRYEARLDGDRLDRSRKYRLVVLGLVAAMFIMGGSVAGLIYWQMLEQDREKWSSQIRYALDKGALQEAEQLVDQLREENPKLLDSPALSALEIEVDKQIADENARIERFNVAIVQAEAATGSHPDLEALKLAEELAVSDQEKVRVEQVRARVQSAKLMAQKQRDDDFTAALDAVRSRFADAQKLAEEDMVKGATAMGEIRTEIGELVKRDGVSSEVAAAAESLRDAVSSRWKIVTKKVMDRQAIDSALVVITTLQSQPEKLAENLRKFASEYPDHELSSEFQHIEGCGDAWSAIAEWSELSGQWKSLMVSSQEEAKQREKAVFMFTKDHLDTTMSEALAGYLVYLKRASNSLDPRLDGTKPGTDLYELLNHPTIAGLSTVRLKSGGVLYLPRKVSPRPLPGQKSLAIKYIANAEQAARDEPLAEKFIELSELADGGAMKKAPQSAFSSDAQVFLASNQAVWATLHLRLCELAKKQAGIDPILRVSICRELMRLSDVHGWPSNPAIENWLDSADTVSLSDPWMDPFDNTLTTKRERAEKVMNEMPSPNALTAQYTTDMRRLTNSLLGRKRIGMVWIDGDGNVTIKGDYSSLGPGVLEIVAKGDGGVSAMKTLGVMGPNGTPEWAETASEAPAGSLVYWRPTESTP